MHYEEILKSKQIVLVKSKTTGWNAIKLLKSTYRHLLIQKYKNMSSSCGKMSKDLFMSVNDNNTDHSLVL